MAKILIIDDSEDDQLVVKRFLNQAGYQDLEFCDTGEDGVAKATSIAPDLVITDTMLPGINGFEVCQMIREALGDKVKIIIMTGSIDAVDAVRARRMGADDYVVKSSDPALMLKAVNRLV